MAGKLDITIETINESARLLRAIDSKKARVLGSTGAYGSGVIARSIPRKKATSRAGSPPTARAPTGQGLKAVKFALDGEDIVTIGHLRFRSRRGRRNRNGVRTTVKPIGKTVPQVLNEGGAARGVIENEQRGTITNYTARYRSRPFRELAFPTINRFFHNRMAEDRLR